MTEPTKRRTEITIERRSVTIIRTRSSHPDLMFCSVCNTPVKPLRPEHAALIFEVPETQLDELLRLGLIHEVGVKGLCGTSIAAHFDHEVQFIED